MKLLLTAFEPFGGESINPAAEAVKNIRERIGDVEIVKLTVPTVFGESVKTVVAAVERERPNAVLCVGQAGGRMAITPERVAINIDDASISDNAGNQPVDEPVVSDAPAAYFSTLPIKKMVAAIRAAGVPASVSNSAGTFVCNHLMYGLLHALDKRFPETVGGFVHIPFLPEQVISRPAPTPCLGLSEIVAGLEAAIEAIFSE